MSIGVYIDNAIVETYHVDITKLELGDKVEYLSVKGRNISIEKAVVVDLDYIPDGLAVRREGKDFYISKFTIQKVIRNGQVIFDMDEGNPKVAI